MNSLDLFLVQYGLAAIFILLFFLGYLGGSLFSIIGHVLPLSWLTLLVLAVPVIVFALWIMAYRRQKAARHEVKGPLSNCGMKVSVQPILPCILPIDYMRCPPARRCTKTVYKLSNARMDIYNGNNFCI